MVSQSDTDRASLPPDEGSPGHVDRDDDWVRSTSPASECRWSRKPTQYAGIKRSRSKRRGGWLPSCSRLCRAGVAPIEAQRDAFQQPLNSANSSDPLPAVLI